MTNGDNPFAPGSGSSNGYGVQSVGFGAPKPSPASATEMPQATAPGADLIKDATTASFQADVIEASKTQPVLVDFWAPWCGPCKQLTPIIEAAVAKAGGAVKLVKMNIDDHPAIPGQMGVQSIPAVIAFVNGQPVDGFMGAQPESQVSAFIHKLAQQSGADRQGAAIDDALAQAQAALDAGDINGAAQIYAMILQQDPSNVTAYAAVAALMIDNGQAERARQMVEKAPDEMKNDPGMNGVKAKLALIDKLADIGDPALLNARLAQNEDDHDARFDLAQIANAKGEREEAADQLLSIMEKDRQWREDGARMELLTFFEAWGPTDPATMRARRKLSSLLFR